MILGPNELGINLVKMVCLAHTDVTPREPVMMFPNFSGHGTVFPRSVCTGLWKGNMLVSLSEALGPAAEVQGPPQAHFVWETKSLP